MKDVSAIYPAADGCQRYIHGWLPDDESTIKAVVHIAHGMAEHGGRYGALAGLLTRSGYAVYANDHRGHGKTAPTADLGFFAEVGGWDLVVHDLKDHIERAKTLHPGLPVILIAHSMGSLMAQQFIHTYGDVIDACVLSGTSGSPPFIAKIGRYVARMERLRLGARGNSPILLTLSFKDFNKKFKPNRTEFDWLTRDEAEVDSYIADPLCGFEVTTQLWIDLLDAIPLFTSPAKQALIPKDLPIYIISGTRDPVGDMGKSVQSLAAAYKTAGLTDVTLKLYEDARHEVLKETNREEVMQELLTWLNQAIG